MKWAIWRPVIAKFDTLTNVKYHWSIDDLADAHEVIEAQEEAELQARQRAKQ